MVRQVHQQQGSSVMGQYQYKVTLPPDLRAQIDSAAQKRGISTAEEIRRRLEQSFDVDYPESLRVAKALKTLIQFVKD
jgi:hypothetical protein